MTPKSKKNSRLKIACEISADRVIAARASEQGDVIEACTARNLPSGTVTPSLTGVNVVNRAALANAVSDVLTGVGGRQRDVIAIIPDAACRISLLDFDELPEKQQEADSVVRFRLRKSLPFDVDRARVSFASRRSGTTVRAVAVVSLTTVIDEYESMFREVGFAPGVVLPSTLAALGAVDAKQPTLVARIAHEAVTLAIAHQDDLLLFRTIEVRGGGVDVEQLADDAYPSLVFFQDTYNLKVERILVGGAPAIEQLAPALEKQTGIPVQELIDSSLAGPAASSQRNFMGGVVGALIS